MINDIRIKPPFVDAPNPSCIGWILLWKNPVRRSSPIYMYIPDMEEDIETEIEYFHYKRPDVIKTTSLFNLIVDNIIHETCHMVLHNMAEDDANLAFDNVCLTLEFFL